MLEIYLCVNEQRQSALLGMREPHGHAHASESLRSWASLWPSPGEVRSGHGGAQPRFTFAQFDLGALALGDVDSGAAIPCESAGLVVHRLAADGIVGSRSVRVYGGEFEVAERPASGELGFMLRPFSAGDDNMR